MLTEKPMKMKRGNYVQILGTGAGDYHLSSGLPPGCPLDGNIGKAWQRGGKDIRHSSAMFITPNILVELGEGTAGQLTACGIPAERIRHLVVSHGHYDHFYPAKALDFADKLSVPLRIHGNGMIRDALDFAATYRWDDAAKEFVVQERRRNYRVKTVTLNKTFALGKVKVTPVLSSHFIDKVYGILEQQALNFVFERGGKTLFYNLDSNWLLPQTLEFLSKYRFDIAIFDATWCDLTIDIKNTGHHNFPMLEKTLTQFRDRGMLKDKARIVYSHLSTDTVPPHEETAARLAQQGVTLAYDGLALEF
ncbi:MAG: hypothetical protein HY318_06825 [Armatimonadetes bacterium]|nr:hypothetical protein [Armatimonadota bacterium]